jgi:hypothetical protein
MSGASSVPCTPNNRPAKPWRRSRCWPGQWIAEHPEYHATLSDLDAALAQMGSPGDANQDNPFLHLSMHLSISEQCSIDQPPGIRRRWNC